MSPSMLIRASRRLAQSSLALQRTAAAPRFESTRLHYSTVHENDPETLEREKQKNLRGEQHKTSTPHEHAPGWNEYLASSSEASVKADRSGGRPEDLQKSTTKHIRERHHADEDSNAQHDTKSRHKKEEVKGPLGGAKGNVADRGERSGGVDGGKP